MALQDPNSKSNLGDDKKTGFTFKDKEIVLSKTRGRPMNQGKGIYGIPDSKRIEVATLFAVLGSIPKVAEIARISEPTLRAWRKQEWFKQLLSEIRDENDERIDSQFTEIIEKSLELVKDRLLHGDHVVLKTGEVVRKPVSVRDLSLVAAINFDKRQLVRGKPTARTETVSSQDQLTKLAETFIALTARGRKPVEITDVSFTEVLPDEPPSTDG